MVLHVESFEGITNGANSPQVLGGFFQIGVTGPYLFASGLRLIQPIPNTVFPEAVVGDFSAGPAGGVHGSSVIAPGDIPDGTAYIRHNTGGLTFDFNGTKVYSVGGYLDAVGASLPTIAAFDAAGNLIAGFQTINVPIADWDTNYVHVISRVPIAKVVFLGEPLVLDEVSFDTAKPKVINGTKGNDKLEGRSSSAGEFVFGKGGKDKINAKAGDDTIDGGSGNDKIKAGDGNDTLLASTGTDVLLGQDGLDTFIFGSIDGVAKLKDFNPVFDTILLAQSSFFGLPQGNPTAEQLVFGTAAVEADDRLIYNQGTGTLGYDGDGTGPGALKVFAKLPPGLALSVQDFFVV
jgi:Ca2+-binding RTX toxin-like protein